MMLLDMPASMPTPGQEDDIEVDAMSIDELIVKLRAGARVGRMHSFRLKAHAVAEPSGIPNPEVDGISFSL